MSRKRQLFKVIQKSLDKLASSFYVQLTSNSYGRIACTPHTLFSYKLASAKTIHLVNYFYWTGALAVPH